MHYERTAYKKGNLCFTKMKTGPKYSYKESSNIKKKKKNATVAPKLFMEIWGIFFYPFCIPQQGPKILAGHFYKNNLFLLD